MINALTVVPYFTHSVFPVKDNIRLMMDCICDNVQIKERFLLDPPFDKWIFLGRSFYSFQKIGKKSYSFLK